MDSKKGFNIKFVSKKTKNIGLDLILSWYIMMVYNCCIINYSVLSCTNDSEVVGPYLAALIITSYLFYDDI